MDSRDWRAVGSVTGWQTAASLCYYTLFAGTALLREQFAISRTLVGLVLTAAMAGYTLALFPSGAAIDGYGEKAPLLVSLLGLGTITVCVSLSPSFPLLLVAAALLGVAYAPAIPGTNRAILTSVPLAERNLAMGIKQVGVTAGSGGAALVVNGLAALFAWQTGFWVVAGVAVLVTLAFASLYADDGGGEVAWPDLRGLGGDPAYVRLVGAGVFVGACIFTMTGYAVLYVDEAVGTGIAFAGVVLTIAQVTGSVGRLGGGARGAGTVMLG